MNIERFIALEKLTEVGSFTETGRILHMSQSSISKSIKYLEEYYNITIFHRERGKLLLTKEGKNLLGYAKKIIGIHKELKDTISQGNAEEISPVTVSSARTIAEYYMPAIQAGFLAKYNKSRIVTRSERNEAILKNVRNASSDFGIIGKVVEDERIMSIPFCYDRLGIAVSKNHRWAESGIKSADELERELLIKYIDARSIVEITEEMFRQKGILPKQTIEVFDIDTLMRMLVNREGYTIFSDRVIRRRVPNELEIVDFRELTSSGIFILFTIKTENSPLRQNVF